MSDTPQHQDERAIMLAELREQLRQARVVFRADVALYRALAHASGAIDDRLGQSRELPPNRHERRQGR